MNANWINDIQNKIYTTVKVRATKNLKDAYPKIKFTMDEDGGLTTSFPSVYIHFLPYAERFSSLTGKTVNSIYCGIRIEVTVSKAQGQYVCSEVCYEIIDQLLNIGFSVAKSPEFVSAGNDVKKCIATMSRMVASGDAIV